VNVLSPVRGLSSRGKRVVDRVLYATVGSRWAAYRSQRAWNLYARRDPLDATAAHDTADMNTYWRSGARDLDLVFRAAEAGGLRETSCALEIGCGLGRLARVASSRFTQVIAIDISEEMLELARKESPAANIRYVQIGTDLRLPVGAKSVDLVYAWTVFRHVSKTVFAHYLSESHRALRPHGCLVFEAQIRESGKPANPFPTEPYTEREYTRAELQEYCAQSGFEWGSELAIPSITAGTFNLVVAWRKPI
jgi:ubiquinone/menaquinone biosynthesis C-methylase UbiE